MDWGGVTLAPVSKPSAQTRFVLEQMEALQKSLEQVNSTLQGLSDKLDAVATEVKSNSEEVVRLTKQVDDFGVDLDVIRRQQLATDKAKRVETVDMEPRPTGARSSGAQPHAVLTNNSRTVLPEPQHPAEFGDNYHDGTDGDDGRGFHPKPAPHPHDHRPQPQIGGAAVFANKRPPPPPAQLRHGQELDGLRGADAGSELWHLDRERRDDDDIRERRDDEDIRQRRDGYRLKPPKHPFPVFKGEFPLLWIDNCYTYFDMYNVPARHWISTATLYFEDHAALWLQAYKRTHRQIIWDSFITAVVAEFGCDEYDGQMSVLLQLRQTGTVTEYIRSFESCMYHLLSVDSSLNSRWFISHFVHGLREDLRAAVRLQHPASVTRAAALARIQEEETENRHTRVWFAPPIKHPTAPSTIAAPGPSDVNRTEGVRRAGDDYTRERQLRDFRQANGLCFRCGDKYNPHHKCKPPVQLLRIELGDFGEVLSDDTVHALKLLDEPVPAG